MQFAIVSFASPAYLAICALRERVLRQPLGLALTKKDKAKDADSIIFAMMEKGMPVACLMANLLDSTHVKFRQMAVDTAYQSQNLGRQLVIAAEAHVATLGTRSIELNARAQVSGFYAKLGYAIEGEMFEEIGIPHVKMVKRLR